MPRTVEERISRSRLASKRSRSRIRAGVSTSCSASPTRAGVQRGFMKPTIAVRSCRTAPRRIAPSGEAVPLTAAGFAECDRHEHQERQVDPPHGGAGNDRAVRARSGARGQRPADRQLRHVELRLRHPLRRRIQDLHQHQPARSSTRRTSTRIPSSTSRPTVCIIPPNSFALARTVEYFRIPRSVLTICLGKSTYARCGIIVNVTPFEPEWEGYVTLEFSNTTPLPAKIYANEGVRAGVVLRERRGLRDLLQGPRRQVPGAAWRHLAAYLNDPWVAGRARFHRRVPALIQRAGAVGKKPLRWRRAAASMLPSAVTSQCPIEGLRRGYSPRPRGGVRDRCKTQNSLRRSTALLARAGLIHKQ